MKVDTGIRHRVLDALRRVPDASRIGVAVDREIVTLAGTVASLDARTNAEKIASSVEGVHAVSNELQVETVSWAHSLIDHVLVAVDLSDEHLGALRYARLFADKLRSRLTVLYADPLTPSPGQESAYNERLRRTVELYAEPHLEPYPFDVAVVQEDAATSILQRVETSHRDLIVMGTSARDEGGHAPGSSVSLAVVSRAHCPVLTVGRYDYPPVQRGVGITTIVCAVNLTPVARESLLLAARLADLFRAHLIVVRVLEPGDTTEIARGEQRLHDWLGDHLPGLEGRRVRPYRVVVTRGLPAPAVLECVGRFDSDLLVIGARQTDAGGTGTTTEEIVRSASTPVLIVPLHAAPRRGAS